MGALKPKKQSPNERWGQLLNGRLTDKQIIDLFDEFGMANRLKTAGDYDWVRHNLPNIPEEIKKILKIELDKENAARKEAAKPQQAPKADAGQGGYGQGGYGQGGDGQGGPTFSGTDTGSTPSWFTSPMSSLVKFNADPNGALPGDASTVWWVDHTTKTLRPIMSEQALKDLYLPDAARYQAALNSITTLAPTELQSGQLKGYMDLGVDYGVYERQQAKKLDFNPQDLHNAYGKTTSQDATLAGVQIVNSFLSLLSNSGSGIDSTFLNSIKNNPTTMALYINAMAYGDYSPDDIYKDIKRQELISKGDTSLANVKVINSNINKAEYAVTNPGRLADTLPSITPPAQIGSVNREIWNSPASMLNNNYYALTDPAKYDPNSQTFKDALASIKTEAYDYFVKSLTATKESDKIVADNEWKQFKTELEKTYGYKFSDNALDAWKQLESLDQAGAEANLSGSGIYNEKANQALIATREQNRRLREAETTTSNTKEASVAKASYSPDQINTMNNEDAAKGLPREQWRAYQWGLVPKDPVSLSSFLADFRSKYPELTTATDAEIKEKYYDPTYDEYGNIRSTIYQTYADNVFKTKFGYDPNSIPTSIDPVSGKTINSSSAYQLTTLKNKNLAADEATQKDTQTLDSGKAFDAVTNPIDYSIGAKLPAATVTAAQNAAANGYTWSDPATGAPTAAGVGTPTAVNTSTPSTVASTPASTTNYNLSAADQAREKQIADAAAAEKASAAAAAKVSSTLANKPATSGVASVTSTPATSSFVVKPGTSYIPNVASMSKYNNIYKDNATGKLYGTLK